MKIKLLTCVTVFLLMGLAYAQANVLSIPPDENVQFENKMGTVTFSHQIHQQITCQSCHHTGNSEKCSTCHGIQRETPTAKKTFHTLCKGCHQQEKSGPTSCRECHIK